jgi:hydrogenase expression/formation protein HypD
VSLARRWAERIAAELQPRARRYSFMEFCGGHTHAIARYGIAELLPAAVRMIHGPGCPVCVLPIGRIDQAIHLALERGAIVATYGDTMRVPGVGPTRGPSGAEPDEGQGARRRHPHGLQRRRRAGAGAPNPDREVVFFAIGFETTTPPTALVIRQAAAEPAQLQRAVLPCADAQRHHAHPGIGRGAAVRHGADRRIHRPGACQHRDRQPALRALRRGIRQAGGDCRLRAAGRDAGGADAGAPGQHEGRAEVENEFTRAVTRDGNRAAQAVVAEVFELRERFEWRGLGEVPYSALKLRPAYAAFDAERRFGLQYQGVPDHKQCECGAILRGVKRPTDCKLFGTVCTPENPMGSCMVSSEGACAAHYSYGRFRDIPVVAVSTYSLSLPGRGHANATLSLPGRGSKTTSRVRPTTSARSTSSTAAST